MESLWLWIPVLGSLMFVENSWTLATDRDRQLRTEDAVLAEVCGWKAVV